MLPVLAANLTGQFLSSSRAHDQQAQRVADYTGFLHVDTSQGGRTGYLVEFGPSPQVFLEPAHALTQQYIRGEFS